LPELQPGHSRIQSLIDNYVVRKSLNCVLEQDPKLRAKASEACRNLLVDYPLVVNERRLRRDASPLPRREIAPQPRREVLLQVQREVAPKPQREIALQRRKEVALQCRRNLAPRPRVVAFRSRREVAPKPQVVAFRQRKLVAPKPRREVELRQRRVLVPQRRRVVAPRLRREVSFRPRVVFERRSEVGNPRPIIIDAHPRGVKPRACPRIVRRPTGRVVAIRLR
jgi:hypothetical protein